MDGVHMVHSCSKATGQTEYMSHCEKVDRIKSAVIKNINSIHTIN